MNPAPLRDPSPWRVTSPRRLPAVLAACLVPMLVGILLPTLFWDQGCLESEALTFIRQYRADRPVLQKVFDPHANDFDTYQARELSYAIDLVDAQAFTALRAWAGQAFLIPLSALVVPVALVLVVGAATWRMTGIPALTLSLLLTATMTSFCFVATMGTYYRSAKPLLAVVVVAAVLYLAQVARQRGDQVAVQRPSRRTRETWIVFALAMIAGMADRQGVFLVGTAAVVLALHVWLTKRCRDLLVAIGAALVVLQLYNFVLAPLVVHALNGYWPTFAYQAIPLSALAHGPELAVHAAMLLVANAVAVLGGPFIGTAVVGGAAVLLGRVVWMHRDRRGERLAALCRTSTGRMALYSAVVLALQIGMFMLMIARHEYVYAWADHHYWYYPLPYAGLLLAGAIVWLRNAWPVLSQGRRTAVNATLVLAVTGNLMSLGHYREVMAGGPWFGPVYAQCQALKASLRSGTAAIELDEDYRAFLDTQLRVRATPSAP